MWFDGRDNTLMDRLKAMPYQTPPWSERYPELVHILTDEPALPKGNSVVRNICWLGKWLDFRDKTEKLVTVQDNFTDADPGFIDLPRNDFRLKDDSPAFKTGFRLIRMDQIGLYRDDSRFNVPTTEVVHLSLEATSPADLRVVVENLGRVPAAGAIEMWVAPEQAEKLRAAGPPEFRLRPGEKASFQYSLELAAGDGTVRVGVARKGSDVVATGRIVRKGGR